MMMQRCAVLLLLAFTTLCPRSAAEQVPFRRAIELALRNSDALYIAAADQQKAYEGYREARNQFVPQVYLGSGIAYSFGFPLGAPSVFNVSSQSFLFNQAQKDFIKAAKVDWNAAALQKEDKRQQVILDTAMSYTELDKAVASLAVLRRQEAAALRAQDIVQQRIQAGIEKPVEGTKAQLNTARVKLRIADSVAAIDNLRTHLSQLTGLPARQFETVTESIPTLPEAVDENAADKAAEASLAVKSAYQAADAKALRAKAERKQLRPAVDLVGQYALFSKFNNYDEFYRTFKRNNGAVGIQIRVPFFNEPQRAHADAADADAVKARKEANVARDQISADTLKLQRSVAQLAAAREVARLEYQISRADTETVQAQVDSGQATLRDLENARLAENDKYAALLDAAYEQEKAQMQLLRATGELEKWALSQP